MTYHLFQKLLECIDPPDSAVPSIDEDFLRDTITPIRYDHDETFGVPTLEELGKYLLPTFIVWLLFKYMLPICVTLL